VLAIDQTPKDVRGSVLGAFGMVGGIGIVFFVLIGGLLFDAVGPHAPFVFIGAGNIVLFGYALWVLRGRFGAGETADPGLSEAKEF
jgi:MFS family permease